MAKVKDVKAVAPKSWDELNAAIDSAADEFENMRQKMIADFVAKNGLPPKARKKLLALIDEFSVDVILDEIEKISDEAETEIGTKAPEADDDEPAPPPVKGKGKAAPAVGTGIGVEDFDDLDDLDDLDELDEEPAPPPPAKGKGKGRR